MDDAIEAVVRLSLVLDRARKGNDAAQIELQAARRLEKAAHDYLKESRDVGSSSTDKIEAALHALDDLRRPAASTIQEAVERHVEYATEGAMIPGAKGLIEVNSTVIKQIGYNDSTYTLTVAFRNNGAIYDYYDVEPCIYQDLLSANEAGRSVGNVYNEKVRNRHSFTKRSPK